MPYSNEFVKENPKRVFMDGTVAQFEETIVTNNLWTNIKGFFWKIWVFDVKTLRVIAEEPE